MPSMRISSPGRNATPGMTRRQADDASILARGQMGGGRPFVNELAAHPKPKTGCAVHLIEILNTDRIPTGSAVMAQAGRTFGIGARDGFSAGCGFPRRNARHGVALQLHRLRF